MAKGQISQLVQYMRQSVRPSASAEDSDRRLLERFAQQQDQTAFAELVQRHGPMVLNACRRILNDAHAAEDAFQATFLVLARKAGAAGWQESIGSWLYEVAYRTSLKAKANTARREAVEQQVRATPREGAMPDPTWPELRTVLDQELSGLPAKYRSPVVLCYLEGKTNEEAAQLLGWTKGTVSGRLARARDLLRDRLTRRGLNYSAGGLAALVTQNVAEAALPPALAESTIKAAAGFAARTTALGAGVSLTTATLAEGVLKAMFLDKLRNAALWCLFLGLASLGLGLVGYQTWVAGAVADTPQKVEGGPPVKGLLLALAADKTETTLRGNVVDPVQLKLTVTNVSDQPIKLNVYRLKRPGGPYYLGSLLNVTDADGQAVPFDVGFLRRPPPPQDRDFTTLAPQESWEFTIDFPGPYYAMTRSGRYRIQCTYADGPGHTPVAVPDPPPALAADSWSGTASSNELVLRVLAVAGPPAKKVLPVPKRLQPAPIPKTKTVPAPM